MSCHLCSLNAMRVEQAIDLLMLAAENNVPDSPGYFTRDGSDYDYTLTKDGRLYGIHKTLDRAMHDIDLRSMYTHTDWEAHFI